MFTLEVFTCFVIILLVIAVVTLIWRDHTIIEDLQREKSVQETENVRIIESFNVMNTKTSTQIADLTDRFINLQDSLDTKLEAQAKKYDESLEKVNNKVDTVLSMVMGCENRHCPTRKKVSEYLNSYKTLSN